ncbi:MAG TPA: hypothetical protein VMZ03_08595 [Chitinophagaceae bacterium]|nr:hypothetical protein [Chitinophagaceae bacterium]
MRIPGKWLIYLLAFSLLAGCKKKKHASLTGNEPVEVSDFIDFFRPLPLPIQFADSSLQKPKQENDSLLLSNTVFNQFIPDSFFTIVYGKDAKPKIYALGKVTGLNKEIYLFVKTVLSNKKAVFIFGFNKRQEFAAGLTALKPDQDISTQQMVVMDRRTTITKTMLRKNKDGTLSEGKDVYSLNADSKLFYLVMTDALEDKPTELINPIDTLQRKNKWSADYTNGKMNLVSVRDGRRSGEISFFIHFDKNNGQCTGELKGEAKWVSANTAEYSRAGDPCKLKFIFNSSSVALKEIEGCGSYRPLRCSFDGSFAKKKEAKPKPVKR